MIVKNRIHFGMLCVIISLLLGVTSCNKIVDEVYTDILESMKNEMTISDGKYWFSTNKETLLSLHKILLNHPGIDRLDIGEGDNYYIYQRLSSADKIAYRKVDIMSQTIGIHRASIVRREGKLLSIDYVIDIKRSSIFSDKEKILSIEYILIPIDIGELAKSNIIVEALDEDHWYVVEYR